MKDSFANQDLPDLTPRARYTEIFAQLVDFVYKDQHHHHHALMENIIHFKAQSQLQTALNAHQAHIV